MKTIIANFEQFKEDPTFVTEDGTDVNKVDKALKSVGINLLDEAGNMRDLGLVIDELGMKWDSLTRNQQAYLATMIAGTRQSSRFYALMNDYDRTLELVAEGANSAGSAQHQYELYTQSLDASIKRLTNSTEAFFNQMTHGNGVLKITVDLLNLLVKGFSILGPVASGAGIVAFLSSLSEITTKKDVLKQLLQLPSGNAAGMEEFFKNNVNDDAATLMGQRYQQNYQKVASKEEAVTNWIKNKLPWKKEKSNIQKQEIEDKTSSILDVEENVSPEKEAIESTGNKIIDWLQSIYRALTGQNAGGGVSDVVDDVTTQQNIPETGKKGKTEKKGKIKKGKKIDANTTANVVSAAGNVVTTAGGTTKGSILGKIAGLLSNIWPVLKKAAVSFLKVAGPLFVLTGAIKIINWAWGSLNDYFGITADANAKKADRYAEEAKTITELGTRYKELAAKINRTAEEELELQEVTNQLAITNKELGQSLRENGENYQANIGLIEQTVEETKKLEAIQRKLANNKEYDGFWNNISKGLSNALLYTEYSAVDLLFGGDKKHYQKLTLAQNEGKKLWYNQAGFVGDEYGLGATQQGMLNSYVTSIIDSKKWNFNDYETSLKEVTKQMEHFASVLADASTLDIERYEQLLQMRNSTNTNYNAWTQAVDNAYIPSEFKALLQKERENYAAQLQRISQGTGVSLAQLQEVNMGTLSRMFNIDLTKFSQDEQKKYYEDLATILNNPNYLKQFENAKSAYSLESFISGLTEAGKISHVFADALMELTTGTTVIERMATGIKKWDEGLSSLQTIMSGLSQSEILEQLSSGTLDMKDVTINAQGQLTVTGVSQVITDLKNARAAISNVYDAQISEVEQLKADLKKKNLQDTSNALIERASESTPTDKDINAYWDKQKAYAKKIETEMALTGIASTMTRVSIPGFSIATSAGKDAAKYYMQNQKAYIPSADIELKRQRDLADARADREGKLDKKSSERLRAIPKIELSQIRENFSKGINNGIITTAKQVAEALKNYNITVSEANNKLNQFEQEQEDVNASLEKQAENLLDLKNKSKAYYDSLIELVEGHQEVYASVANINSAFKQVDSFGDIAKAAEDGLDFREEIELWQQYPMQMAQLFDASTGQIDASTAAIRKNTDELIQNTIAQIKIQEEDLKLKNKALQTALNNLEDLDDAQVESVAEQISREELVQDSQEETFNAESLGLTNSLANWETWSQKVRDAISKVNEAVITTIKNANGETKDADVDVTSTITGTKFNNDIKGIDGNGKEKTPEDYRNIFKGNKTKNLNYLKDQTGLDSEDEIRAKIQKRIDANNEQLAILESFRKRAETWKLDPLSETNAYKSEGGSSSGTDNLTDLEKFYYYLKMIDKLESEIAQSQQRADLRDTYEFNHYTEDLQDQIMLLNEERDIYTQLNKERGSWLEEEQKRLQSAYDWVQFTEDGMLFYADGLKVTNEQQEEINEYVNQWESHLEAVSKVQELISKQVEATQKYYEKINKSIVDALEGIDRIMGHSTWWAENGFTDLGKINMQVDAMRSLQKQINLTQNSLNEINKTWEEAQATILSNDWGDYLKYNEFTSTFDMTDAGNQLATTNKDEYERILAAQTAFNGAVQNYEEYKSRIESQYDALQNQITMWGDMMKEISNRWFAEVTKIFDSIDEKIAKIDLEESLYGTKSGAALKRQDLLVQKMKEAEVAYNGYQKNYEKAKEVLEKEYADYIYKVNGEIFVNEAAIASSTELTQKELENFRRKTLEMESYKENAVTAYETMTAAQQEYAESLMSYRDMYIDLLNTIRTEKQEEDQEELDALQKKYDEMKQLDDEYYNNLSKKISKQRELRNNRQSADDIQQLQQRIALLQRNGGTSYSTELADLQSQLREQLQSQADTDIDRELEKIKEEQEEREKQRQIETEQLANLIALKEETRQYWTEAQQLYKEGITAITNYLGMRYQKDDISNADMIKQTESIQNTAIKVYEMEADKISQDLGDIYDKIKEIVESKPGETAAKAIIDGLNENIKALETSSDESWTSFTQSFETFHLEWLKYTTSQQMKINAEKWQEADARGEDGSAFVELNRQLIEPLNKVLESLGQSTYKLDGDGVWRDSEGNALYLPHQMGTDSNYAANSSKVNQINTSKPAVGGSSFDSAEERDKMIGQGARYILKQREAWAAATTTKEKDKIAEKTEAEFTQGGRYAQLGWTRDSYTGQWYSSDKVLLTDEILKRFAAYSKGGLVDYTGFALVHGNPTAPEAFLNAKQTALFAQLRDSLTAKKKDWSSLNSSSTGETIHIEGVEIAVKELAEIDDINKFINVVKQSIYKDAMGNGNLKLNRR